jgi:hypothetical protein
MQWLYQIPTSFIAFNLIATQDLTDQQLTVILSPTLDSPRERDIIFTEVEVFKNKRDLLS